MLTKTFAALLLAAFLPNHCDHWPPGGGSGGSGGSAGTAGTGGTGGSPACPDSATLTFTYVSGSFGPIEDPWVFDWPQPEEPACDSQWTRDETTCLVTIDQECLYEDVNIAPGLYVDELTVRSSSFEMVDGGEGVYSVVFTQFHPNGNEFTDDGNYTLDVSVP